jgi:hypothetical protein
MSHFKRFIIKKSQYGMHLNYFLVTKINRIGFDRKTLSSISHKSSFGQFQIVGHSQVRRRGKASFYFYLFLIIIFQHHIHKEIFNTFFINLHHLIFLQWNLNPIQLNLNPIVELEFNSIYMKYHSIFSLKCSLIFTKSIFFFHQSMI